MSLTTALLLIAVMAAFLVYNHSGQISSRAAKAYLRNGATVIDVRSAGEYTGRHLPNAVNLPLSEIEALILRERQEQRAPAALPKRAAKRSGQENREGPWLHQRLQPRFLWPRLKDRQPQVIERKHKTLRSWGGSSGLQFTEMSFQYRGL